MNSQLHDSNQKYSKRSSIMTVIIKLETGQSS